MANIDLSSSKIHSKPKVFISYSHDSEKHISSVLNLSERLREEGVNCWINEYYESGDIDSDLLAESKGRLNTSQIILIPHFPFKKKLSRL
jgi:hypothetical protein